MPPIDGVSLTDEDLNMPQKYQLHSHRKNCSGKAKNCRFGFPKPPMKSTKLLRPLPDDFDESVRKKLRDKYQHVLEVKGLPRGRACPYSFLDFLKLCGLSPEQYILVLRSSLDKPEVFLERQPNTVMVNAYNPLILLMWRANIDTQYILDICAVIMYITAYMTKPNKGMSLVAADPNNCDMKKLRKLGQEICTRARNWNSRVCLSVVTTAINLHK